MCLNAVLQHLNHMESVHFGITVNNGILVALFVQPFHAFLCLLQHFATLAKLQCIWLARCYASRLHAILNSIDASRAFVDSALGAVVLRYMVGARRRAALAADALGLVHGNHARFLVLVQGACRTHRNATGVGAVLARTTPKRPGNALLAIGFALIERDDQARVAVDVGWVLVGAGEVAGTGIQFRGRRQVVPAFAGNLAALARGALGGIE